MDILSIVLIVVCLICAGAAVVFWKKANSASSDVQAKEQLAEEKSKLLLQLADADSKLKTATEQKNAAEQALTDANSKVNEAELALTDANSKVNEANNRVKDLEQKCEQALSGNFDGLVQEKLGEVTKLQKKISDLENDLEDMEDDLDEAKKSLNKKKAEYTDLEESFENEKREKKRIEDELKSTQFELSESQEKLALGSESLSFVKEILMATPVNDGDMKRLYTAVDELAEFIENDIPHDEQSKQVFTKDLKSWSETQKKSWIQGKTAIAFVGEFSAGKTSIVNRILSQDDPDAVKLPVSTKATTAIPTYISGGESTRFQFFTPDNVLKGISKETFKRVTKEVLDQVDGVSNLIQYFVMNYKNPNLNKLSILDTPGFNSGDSEDATRTLGVINECDALFWVFDVNAGTVNRSSIDLIKRELKRPLYVVINKVDTKSSSEVDSVENLIKKTLNEAGLKVEKFIRFSGKEPLGNLMNVIKSVKHESARDGYLDFVRTEIEKIIREVTSERDKRYKAYNTVLNQSNKLVDQYNNLVQHVGNMCVEAAGIPHFEEHLFRKDGYEMSIEDFNRMTNILNDLCDTEMNNFCELYNDQMQKRQELQQKWEEYLEMVAWVERAEEVKNSYERKVKRLKKN